MRVTLANPLGWHLARTSPKKLSLANLTARTPILHSDLVKCLYLLKMSSGGMSDGSTSSKLFCAGGTGIGFTCWGGGMVDPGRICAANMWRGGGVVKILTQVSILQMEQL